MAKTGILDLPAELLAQILTHLPDQTIFDVRRSSKHIEHTSFAYFGKRFFRKKGYMITRSSLGTLHNIALHYQLRTYVQHLWFNPDCFTFIATPRSNSALEQCQLEHSRLMTVDTLTDCFIQILSQLPNLRTIGMRRSEDHRPRGWKELRSRFGEDPRVLGPIPSGPSSTLSGPTILFHAIINATAVTRLKLQRLYTDAVEIDNIQPDLLTQETLNIACAGILYLEINCTKAWLREYGNDQPYRILQEPNDFGGGLIRLLKAAPRLREIGLQIFPDRKQRHMVAPDGRRLESWLRSYQYLCLSHIADSVELKRLTRIKLEKVTTSALILRTILEPCKDVLRSLKLRDVRLISSETPMGDRGRPWQSIFQFLLDCTPKLSYLLLYHIMSDHGAISFIEDPPPALSHSETDVTGSHNPAFGDGTATEKHEYFANYHYIALEAKTVPTVRERLAAVVEKHWYHRPIFSYPLDEDMWHTDTSDEEW